MENRRKRKLPRWLTTLIMSLFGSQAFLNTIGDLSQKKIDAVQNELAKASWQLVKDNGLRTIEILTDNDLDNRRQLEELIENNIDALLGLGFDPLKQKIVKYTQLKALSQDEVITINNLLLSLEQDAKDFDLVTFVKNR